MEIVVMSYLRHTQTHSGWPDLLKPSRTEIMWWSVLDITKCSSVSFFFFFLILYKLLHVVLQGINPALYFLQKKEKVALLLHCIKKHLTAYKQLINRQMF